MNNVACVVGENAVVIPAVFASTLIFSKKSPPTPALQILPTTFVSLIRVSQFESILAAGASKVTRSPKLKGI